MKLIYDSLTGNVRRFAGALAAELGLSEPQPLNAAQPDQGYLLLTYTFGTGEVPGSTRRFLAQHGHLLRGVVSSGSYHWGPNFGRAGDLIAAEYGVPLVGKINKGGTAADREQVAAWIRAAGQPLA